jgi:hypothetical protein
MASFEDLTRGRIPDWGAACAFPSEDIIILKSPRIMEVWKEDIGTILQHELVHVYAFRISPRIPRWFDEGLAIFLSGEWSLWNNLDLAVAAVSGNLIPLDEMDLYPEGEKRAHLFYLQSYSTVAFLSTKLGKNGLMTFLYRLMTSGSFDHALRQEARITSRDFEAEWRKWISRHYHPTTLLLRSEVIITIAIIVLLIAYIGKKRRYRRRILEMEQREQSRTTGDEEVTNAHT